MDNISSMYVANRFLEAMLGDPKMVTAWWHSPNYSFGMKTPYEVFQKNPKIVVDYLHGCAEDDY